MCVFCGSIEKVNTFAQSASAEAIASNVGYMQGMVEVLNKVFQDIKDAEALQDNLHSLMVAYPVLPDMPRTFLGFIALKMYDMAWSYMALVDNFIMTEGFHDDFVEQSTKLDLIVDLVDELQHVFEDEIEDDSLVYSDIINHPTGSILILTMEERVIH